MYVFCKYVFFVSMYFFIFFCKYVFFVSMYFCMYFFSSKYFLCATVECKYGSFVCMYIHMCLYIHTSDSLSVLQMLHLFIHTYIHTYTHTYMLLYTQTSMYSQSSETPFREQSVPILASWFIQSCMFALGFD